MNFDLTDLRVFVAIAEAKNMTQGAKNVFLSTTAASIRIKLLEEQLGTRLLYRHNRGVDLTPAGEILLQQARQLNHQVNAIKAQFSGHAEDSVGHVRIYANTTAVTEILPTILSQFLATRPAVTIDLQEQLTSRIIRAVLDGSTDIGVLAGQVLTDQLEQIHFSTDYLTVVVAENHKLATYKSVKFHDTLHYPFIGMHSDSTLQAFLHEKMAQVGVEMTQRISVYGFDSMCRLIESNVGIGIVPYSAAKRLSQTMKITIIKLDEPWSERPRSIIVKNRKKLPLVTQSLIDLIVTSMQ